MSMKRLHLLAIFRMAWLMLALVVGVLWWRSNFWDDRITYTTADGTDYSAHCFSGRLVVSRYDHFFVRDLSGFSPAPGFKRESTRIYPAFGLSVTRTDGQPFEIQFGPLWQWHGFSWQHEGPGYIYDNNLYTAPGIPLSASPPRPTPPPAPVMLGRWHWLEVGVPLWMIEVVLSLPLVLWAWQIVRDRRRPKPGICPNCGYDLRASPQRCPECGTPKVDPHLS